MSADTNERNEAPATAKQLAETRDGGFDEAITRPAEGAKAMPYAAGEVIANKYRLSNILGEGGMGAVWLARNLALEIDVAIKLIRHDYANTEAAPRLLQEARAAARIGHPSIVRVFDFGTTERADPFIVMEVLQGESLAETLSRKGRLSAVSAVRTLLPVASALAAAHGKGIIHRDLKPDNIRLVTDDRGAVVPKIVDFGIAKLHHDESPRETTQAGVILGSPHYMSPEQACGRSDVDHRTDIWAFSVMLYEVIAGVRPFEGANYNALISSILVFNPTPWTEHDIDEPELWMLIDKGLAKEPADRWQTMQEFGEALANWAAQRDIETDAAGNSLRAHWLAASMHRPLSEFPSSGVSALDHVRPRMNSEREIRIPRAPSLPDIVLPNPSIPAEPPSVVLSQPTPPSSLPMTTTRSEPPARRRSPAMWIGPLALAVGAMLTGAFIELTDKTQSPDNQNTSRPAATVDRTDKPATTQANLSPPTPTSAPSTASTSSAVLPTSSAAISARVASSVETTALPVHSATPPTASTAVKHTVTPRSTTAHIAKDPDF